MAAALPFVAPVFGLSGLAAATILGKKDKPVTPAPAPAPTMPIADDEAVRRAKRRSIAMQLARGGRSSTILTGDGDKLGGY